MTPSAHPSRRHAPARRAVAAVAVAALACAALALPATSAAAAPVPAPYQLSIVAGTYAQGRPVVGPATSSRLFDPSGVAVRADGAVVVADSGNSVVEEVGAAAPHDLRIVTGDGVAFSSWFPTAGSASSSRMATPAGVAIDRWGNTYVSDAGLGKVVKIDTAPTPQLSIVAGDVSRPWVSGAPTPGGPATSSLLRQPLGLAVDHDGDVYIADAGNNVVEKVDAATGVLTVVAGDGAAFAPGAPTPGALATSSRLRAPAGVAVDGAGNLYIADTGNNVVSKVDATTGRVSVVAGDGTGFTAGPPTSGAPATASGLDAPNGVAVDGAGNLYIADSRNNVVSMVDTTGRLRVLAGGRHGFGGGAPVPGAGTDSDLGYPTAVAVDAAGAVYATEWSSDVVVKLTPPPGTLPVITSAPPAAAQVGAPYSSVSTASAGASPVTWSAGAGSLPPGLSLDPATGAITGTPTSAGTWSFTLQATTTAGYDTQAGSIRVAPAPPAAPPLQQLSATAPASVPLGARTYALHATASAPTGPAGELTYASTTPDACSADASGVVAVLAVGTCSVTVSVAPTPTAAGTSLLVTTAVTATGSATAALPEGELRLGGEDRSGASTDTAGRVFGDPQAGTSTDVVVATSASFADSLSGARLAGQTGGPLLLTDGDHLADGVAEQVRRLVRPGGRVHLLGGTSALSADVERAVDDLVGPGAVDRLGGDDRYATAVAVAEATTTRAGDVGPVYLVTGRDFADGASVAALAQSTGGVVLLTDGSRMPAVTAAYLAEHDPADVRAVAVGGPARAAAAAAGLEGAVGRAVVGADRFETSARLVASAGSAPEPSVGLAGGDSWADALSGAAAMAALGGPLLLTTCGTDQPPASTVAALDSLHPRRVLLFGGAAAPR